MDLPMTRMTSAAAFLAIILLVPLSGFAGLTAVDPATAFTAAHNWLQFSQEKGWTAAAGSLTPSLQEIRHEGQLVGYSATIEGGFVIMPAYRELPPVSAYSFTSSFDANDEGGFVQMIREQLAYKIAVAEAVADVSPVLPEMRDAVEQVTQDREHWLAFSANYDEFRRAEGHALDDSQSIDPLLSTAWRQGTPYNSFCPIGDGGRSLVGCVATAAAQILAYWHSAGATGGSSYTWNGDQSCGNSTPSQILSATYSDGYDWANMLNVYTSGYTQAQSDAVAELCYEVGVALHMDYGRCGSGASTAYVATIFPQYFGMQPGVDVEYRNAYATADAWFAMLQAELNAYRPMQYRINTHSIVCDGWQVYGSNQIHLNYGWGNGYTAWYTVDALYCPWAGCDPQVEYTVRFIRPADAPPPVALTVVSPNGGENLSLNSTYTILWNSTGLPENVAIEINRAFPTGPWEVVAENIPNDGTEAWTVSGTPSTTVRIRVHGTLSPDIADTSNSNLAISEPVPNPTITVTAPNGGENWNLGTTHNITWVSQYLNENVTIEIKRPYPSGSWETLVASTENDGVWAWTVAGATNNRARIRVRAISQFVSDVSDANFAIGSGGDPASITLVSPNGGEAMEANSLYSIHWTSQGIGGNVKIMINRNYPGGNWQTIVNRTTNDGEYGWLVSGSATAHARIKITGASSTEDVSDGDFQIVVGQYSAGSVPQETGLAGVYPNPFNPSTEIRYRLSTAQRVKLDVFDITGRQVAVLVEADQPEGEYTVRFDGAGLGAGLYFVRLQAGHVHSLQKVYLLK